jgi:hypothetical protein
MVNLIHGLVNPPLCLFCADWMLGMAKLNIASSINGFKPFLGALSKAIVIVTFYRSIEGNGFSGPIPPEIGKLINLKKL